MILCHAGPPWGLLRGLLGPKMAQNSTKMAKNTTKMALHGPKCPHMTPNGPKTLPMGILHDYFWSRRTIFGDVLGQYGAPVGL